MTAAEKLIAFIRNSFDTALYFAVMAVKENFRNYVGRAGTVGRPAQSMVILGNGPSLAGDLPRLIERREYETEDFLAVNFFAEDDRFEVVKPKYYVLSDPMFFRDSACRDRVRALYATLARKVAWPMNLYVQYYNPEGFDYRAALPNSNIRIVRFHTQMYRGFRSLEFWLFRRGLGSANFGTVVQVGEYVCWGISGSSFTAWTIRCWTDSAWTMGTGSAASTATITTERKPPRRSLFTRRFPMCPIRWRTIWPKSPNCSAATKSCATMPPRSVRGSSTAPAVR